MQNNNLYDNTQDLVNDIVSQSKETQTMQPTQPLKTITPKQEVANAISDKTISDSILAGFDKLMNEGQITIPDNYPLGNELKLAFYDISSKGYLASATKQSIGNAISEMAVQGLSVAKRQGYFIKYGNEVSFQRSYFGDIALVKRTGLVKDVYAVVINEGDEFEMGLDEYGKECVIKHKKSFENIDKPIIGAYAVAVGINNYKMYCIMTKKQIDANWNLSKDSTRKFQKSFPEEASKRTAIRRLIKMIFNTAIDLNAEQTQIIGLYNNTSSDEYENNETKYANDIDNHVKESTGEIIENIFDEQ